MSNFNNITLAQVLAPRHPGPVEQRPTRPGELGRPPRPTPSVPMLDVLVSLLAVGAIAGLANVRGVWIVQVAEFLLLLSVPGLLLLRALRAEPDAVRRFPVYVLCGSIAVLMAGGLLVDLAGPAVGISRPLTTVPLAVSISLVCVVLIGVSAIGGAPPLGAYVGSSIRLHRIWPLVLPVIAWAGATRLNNGHGDAVAIVAVAATGVALLVGVWGSQRWSVAQSAVLVYAASLALMWGFSLRGHFVYGFDINGEYQTFIQVLHAGRWHTAHHNDAYGAMLSLTILPSTLTTLTGASPLLVLKAIFPFLFAAFPVGVFLLATRGLRLRFAYLAVLFIVVQNYLFQQMPAIARQEIALLFFVCLVAALTDNRLTLASQLGLFAVFGLGLVLSHYGTTYITIALLATATVLELARRAIAVGLRRSAPDDGARRRGPPLVALVAPLAIVAVVASVWYAPVTDSTQNLSSFVSDLSDQGLSLLPNSGGQGVVGSYLQGNVATRVDASSYAARVRSEAVKSEPYLHPLPQALLPAFRVRNASVPGQHVKSHPLLEASNAEQVVVMQLAILLAAIGAVWLWLRRATEDALRVLALLGVSTVAILVLIRFSGTAANEYNQNRAFLQAMVPLAICLAWVLERASLRPRFGRAVAGAAALALGALFLSTTGLRAPITGGGSFTNTSTKGEDYERYYVAEPDLAAARWVNAAATPRQTISADRYGQLRITGATGRSPGVLANVTPTSLDRGTWIYADSANFLGLRARGQDGSRYAIYVWPSFIGRYWNLVYSNGSSAVYARTPWRVTAPGPHP